MGTALAPAARAALALALAAATASAGLDERVRPGKWNPRKPPPGWVVIVTDHYQVQSHVGEEKARGLAEHLEGMLALYGEVLPFRRKMPDFVLKLFASRDEYLSYSPWARSAAAYYYRSNKELVAYDPGIVLGKRDVPARIALSAEHTGAFSAADHERLSALFEAITDGYVYDLASVLSHEGWHQYFHYYTVSWVSMPAWLDEGLGDYFFTAVRRPDGGYRLGDVNHYRLRVIQRAFDEGDAVPFGKMLDFEQRDYYANPGVFYSQGWSMVHFLMTHEDPARRELIPKLIRDFKGSKNFRKSSRKIFRGLDLDTLDRQWIGHVLALEAFDPMLTLAEEFGPRIRPDDLDAKDSWRSMYAWHRRRLGFAEDG